MQPNADISTGIPATAMPSETTLAGGVALDPAVLEQVARYVQQTQAPRADVIDGAHAAQGEAPVNAWIDQRTIRGVLRTALLDRIEQFGQRELRQRSAQEIAFILLTFAVAALVAGPALVPLVVALRGGQL